jgi:hypothetical protein
MDDSTELEYVGFWLRVWAAIIDTILILLITAPLLLMVSGGQSWGSDITSTSPSDILISYVLPALAVIIFWSICQDRRRAKPGTERHPLSGLFRLDHPILRRLDLGRLRQEKAGMARQDGRYRGGAAQARPCRAGALRAITYSNQALP